MRIDHIAYQQAVRVAGGGLLLQLGLGLTLLIFGRLAGDTAFVMASAYVLAGLPIWIGLLIVFHQHRLERLEALESDELAAARGETTAALFERDGAKVMARRLRFMHTWLMPIISLFVAASYLLVAYWIIDYFRSLDDANRDIQPFSAGEWLGWQLAIAIALSLVAFIFSRFVAGMSRQAAWQNLRGGAGAMVGNALVLLAIAIGITFHFFQKPAVLEAIAYGIAIFLIAVAAEILLNFILNLYRPRRVGETPRPAFDSRVLSLFAAPDSIVRSINEAVNYQFGFDITSSWGYRLLLRSVGWLGGFAVAVLLLLSCLVVIEPGEQGLRLRFGRIIGGVYEQTTMLKLPWPIETARVETVGSVRALPLGNAPAEVGLYKAWGDEGMLDPNRNVWVVAASDQRATISEALRVAAGPTEPASDGPADGVADQFALVDADLVVNYRIRDGRFEEWSRFASDARLRRGTLDMREKALKAIAMRDATQYLSAQPLNRLLSPPSDTLELELKSRIQTSFDAMKTGVEVISVTVPRLRPPGGIEAQKFLELSIATQNARKVVEEARSLADLTMSSLLGSREKAEEVSALITRYNDLQNAAQAKSSGPDAVDSEAIKSLRREIEQAISGTQAEVAAVVAGARAARWEAHMKARSQTAAVLGQAPAWEVDPELFQQRAVMRVLAETLPRLRVKFILGIDPARVRLGVDFQEPDAGLNIADYLQKPEG